MTDFLRAVKLRADPDDDDGPTTLSVGKKRLMFGTVRAAYAMRALRTAIEELQAVPAQFRK